MEEDFDFYNNETPFFVQNVDNDQEQPQQIPQKKKTKRVPRIQVNGNHITKTDPKITSIRKSFKFQIKNLEGDTSYTDDEVEDEDKKRKRKKTKKKTKKKYKIDLNRFAMIAKNCMYLPNQKFQSAECRLGEAKSHVEVFANGTIKIIAPSHEEIQVCLEKAIKYMIKSSNFQFNLLEPKINAHQIIWNAKLPYKVDLPPNMKIIKRDKLKYKIYKSGFISFYGQSEDEIQKAFEELCEELRFIEKKKEKD